MKTYKNLKKGTKIGLIVSAVLLLAVLVNDVFAISQAFASGVNDAAIMLITDSVMSLLVLLYAFWGYKKPHGNMLKITFLVYAVYTAFQGMIEISTRSGYVISALVILTGLILAYIAGRLNRIEQNVWFLALVGLFLLVRTVIHCVMFPVVFGFTDLFGRLTPIITFAALGFAYVARFEEHKAAGLADKY